MTQGADGDRRGTPPSDGDLASRLSRLDEKLQRSVQAEDAGGRNARADGPGLSRALRMSSEFVAGVVAGGLIGWAFDQVLGSRPWGLIIFVLLGFAAGVLNVMRSAGLAPGPGSK